MLTMCDLLVYATMIHRLYIKIHIPHHFSEFVDCYANIYLRASKQTYLSRMALLEATFLNTNTFLSDSRRLRYGLPIALYAMNKSLTST